MTATEEPPRRRGRPPSGGREAILDATLELIREQGIANLTSREVAARAGVSDASVYYHFGDRSGLLRAVFEHAMQPLAYLSAIRPGDADRRAVLSGAARALERFFTGVLPVLSAAQSDPALAEVVAAYVAENDLGPHKGVIVLGDYLRGEQAAGRVNADVDIDAVALMLIETTFGLVTIRQWLGTTRRLPSLDRVVDQVNRLLD